MAAALFLLFSFASVTVALPRQASGNAETAAAASIQGNVRAAAVQGQANGLAGISATLKRAGARSYAQFRRLKPGDW
jgi:hypothetical protein